MVAMEEEIERRNEVNSEEGSTRTMRKRYLMMLCGWWCARIEVSLLSVGFEAEE